MKSRKITFRVTDEEFVKIQWNAKANDQTVTGYIRNVVLNHQVDEHIHIWNRKVYVGMLELYQKVGELEKKSSKNDKSYTEIREKLEDITYDLLQNSERRGNFK